MSLFQTKQPLLLKEFVTVSIMIFASTASSASGSLAKNASQPHAYPRIDPGKRSGIGLFEVFKPTTQREIHIGDDALQAEAGRAFQAWPQARFEFRNALLSRKAIVLPEFVAEKLERRFVTFTIRVFSGCSFKPASATQVRTSSKAR